MKKAYKCALIETQINKMLELIKDNDNMVEIQLLSLNDDLELMNKFDKRICTIHLPIEAYPNERTCNLSSVIEACRTKNERYNYLNRVAKYALEQNAGIVIHMNKVLEIAYKLPGYDDFIEWVKETGVRIYLENTCEITDARKSLLSPVYAMYSINQRTNQRNIRSLLDICHCQISMNQYNSNLSFNLSQIVDLYGQEDQIVHFATAIGNGDNKTGGVHGSNFKENPELLEALLRDLYKTEVTLVLETGETDFVNKPNAVWLNNKIDEIIASWN